MANEKCRLCAGNASAMSINLLDISHQKHANEVSLSLQLEINSENGFPTRMCFNCLLVLTNWISLKEKTANCHKLFCQQLGVIETCGKISRNVSPNVALSSNPPDMSLPSVPIVPAITNENNISTKTQNPTQSEVPCSSQIDQYSNENFSFPYLAAQHFLQNYNFPEIHEGPPLTFSKGQENFDCGQFVLDSADFNTNNGDNENSKQRKYACHLCNKRYPVKRTLQSHYRIKHKDYFLKYPHQCHTCNERFETEFLLVAHMQDAHSGGSISQRATFTFNKTPPKKKKSTKDANGKSPKKAKTSDEKDTEKQEYEKLKCPLCFGSYVECFLQQHLRTKHNISEKEMPMYFQPKPIECTFCGKIFKMYCQLKQHLLTHTLPFRCSICKIRFKIKEEFIQHQLSHDNTGVTCDYCKRTLSTKSTLARHIVTQHFGAHSRTIQCEYCPAKFKTQYCLTYHIHKHHRPDLKPLMKCKICNISFNLQIQFQKHNMKYHQEKVHSCHICGKIFTQNRFLLQHIKEIHQQNYFENTLVENATVQDTEKPEEIIVQVKSEYIEQDYMIASNLMDDTELQAGDNFES